MKPWADRAGLGRSTDCPVLGVVSAHTHSAVSPSPRLLPLSGRLEVGKLSSDSSGCCGRLAVQLPPYQLSPAQHSAWGFSQSRILVPSSSGLALLPQDKASRAPWLWEARGCPAPVLSSGKDPGAERVSTHSPLSLASVSPHLKPGLWAGPCQPHFYNMEFLLLSS